MMKTRLEIVEVLYFYVWMLGWDFGEEIGWGDVVDGVIGLFVRLLVMLFDLLYVF